jgi:FtsZ-binding cell division protein ZapB
MAKTSTTGLELEPIDRLAEKLKLLVGIVDRLKSEQSRLTDENQRLATEVELLRTRVAAGETLSGELSALREERDLIRTRVSEMLGHLDTLEL